MSWIVRVALTWAAIVGAVVVCMAAAYGILYVADRWPAAAFAVIVMGGALAVAVGIVGSPRHHI